MQQAFRFPTWDKFQEYAFFVLFTLAISSQFFYDPSSLPFGFEKAKVDAVQSLGFLAALILGAGLVLSPSVNANKVRKFLSSRKYALIASLIIYVLVLLATATSPYPEIAWSGSKFRFMGIETLTSLFMLFWFSLFFFRREYLNRCLIIFIFLTTVHALIGFSEATRLSQSEIAQGFYVNGNYGQSNFYGGTLVAGASIILAILLWRFRLLAAKLKFVLGFSFIIHVTALALSFSIGSWVVMTFMTVIIILNRFLRFNFKRGLVITSVLIILFAAALLIYTYHNDASRRLFWDATSQLILQRPLMGYGSDTLNSAYQQGGYLQGRHIDRTHNLYLDIVFNYGIGVMVILFLFISEGVKRVYQSVYKRELITPLIIMLVFALTGLIHTKSIYHFAEFSIVSGILFSIVSRPSIHKESLN